MNGRGRCLGQCGEGIEQLLNHCRRHGRRLQPAPKAGEIRCPEQVGDGTEPVAQHGQAIDRRELGEIGGGRWRDGGRDLCARLAGHGCGWNGVSGDANGVIHIVNGQPGLHQLLTQGQQGLRRHQRGRRLQQQGHHRAVGFHQLVVEGGLADHRDRINPQRGQRCR